MKLRMTVVGVIAMLAAALGVVSVQMPASAVACTYGGCTGKDPEVNGCSADATTVSSFMGHYRSNISLDVYVELRHSNACHARWTRFQSRHSDWGCGGGAQPYIRVRNLTSGGSLISSVLKAFSACSTTRQWTNMVGRSSGSYKVQYAFNESNSGWCSDSFYWPCVTKLWP